LFLVQPSKKKSQKNCSNVQFEDFFDIEILKSSKDWGHSRSYLREVITSASPKVKAGAFIVH
jgi:hypothetical protein